MITSPAPSSPAAPLAEEPLLLASGGLGMPSNNTAHSMAYFRDALYVGTTTSGQWGPHSTPRILRFDPRTAEWRVVYRPPLLPATPRAFARDVQVQEGKGQAFLKRKIPAEIPRDFGYRAMTVFQGATDPEPALYVASLSLWGGIILRSLDGETFDVVCEPGFGDDRILSFRGLVGFGGRLYVSAAGTITEEILDRNFAPQPTIYCSADPARGTWQEAGPPGFGDPTNGAIYSLAVANGALYAGTNNRFSGFQLWRTTAQRHEAVTWQRVLTAGAYRYNLNMASAAMAEFAGALYVGGGIPGFGYDKANDIGPAAAELIRVWPDGRWDLIFGEPRFTPDGLKVPLSGHGPGLDDPYNSVVWSMAAHDGKLFVGTHQWQPFEDVRANGGMPRGGYQLWVSRDGERFDQLIREGNGNFGVTGLRSLLSTPFGLVLGTANHTDLLRMLTTLRGGSFPPTARPGFEVLLV
jgi:hypothetical protein